MIFPKGSKSNQHLVYGHDCGEKHLNTIVRPHKYCGPKFYNFNRKLYRVSEYAVSFNSVSEEFKKYIFNIVYIHIT